MRLENRLSRCTTSQQKGRGHERRGKERREGRDWHPETKNEKPETTTITVGNKHDLYVTITVKRPYAVTYTTVMIKQVKQLV